MADSASSPLGARRMATIERSLIVLLNRRAGFGLGCPKRPGCSSIERMYVNSFTMPKRVWTVALMFRQRQFLGLLLHFFVECLRGFPQTDLHNGLLSCH